MPGFNYVNGRFGTDDDQVCINLSGGLTAKGQLVGATGASMHALVNKQLGGADRPGSDEDDSEGRRHVGGSGVSNAVTVLRRAK